MQHHHRHVAHSAAALAAAMGIGRFVYTPIIPLMTAQTGVSAHAAATLATANYVGYLAGAVAGFVSPRLARSVPACRAALAILVATLAAMPCATTIGEWTALRTVAGMTSALVFVIAVNTLLEHLHGRPAHLAGWGFGGIGAGIALSAGAVLASGQWKWAWWVAAGLAALLAAVAWPMRRLPAHPAESPVDRARRPHHGAFSMLAASYTLEGVGYIIAGTYLVAAVADGAPQWLGGGTWLVVGLATVPSAALWAALTARWSHRRLLVVVLCVQAAGIALAGGATGVAAALVGATLFGGTFVGASTLSLGAGRSLRYPRAVPLLTAGYSVGQIVGPLSVSPLLRDGFRQSLIVAALVVSVAALAAGMMGVVGRQPGRRIAQAEIADL